jgi:hypothetical protein
MKNNTTQVDFEFHKFTVPIPENNVVTQHIINEDSM